MRISDWSSDVCSSDLAGLPPTLVSFALGDFAGILLVVPIMLALADQFGPERRPWPLLLAYGVALASPAVVLGMSLRPSIEAPIYPLALALLPLFLVAYRYGWRSALPSSGRPLLPTHT